MLDFDPATTLVFNSYATSVWHQPLPFEVSTGPEHDGIGANLLDPISGIYAWIFVEPDDAAVDSIKLDEATVPLAAPFRTRLDEIREA